MKKTVIGLVIYAVVLVSAVYLVLIGTGTGTKEETTTEKTTTQMTTVEPQTEKPLDIKYPYEGMPESYIDYTDLGPHTGEELCSNFDSLIDEYKVKYYIWEKDGKVIFKVAVMYWSFVKETTVPGYVSNVWDLSKPETTRGKVVENTTTTEERPMVIFGGSTNSKKEDDSKESTTEETTKKDRYNVDKYKNEEDFYDANYDYFMDYYEAEAYYKKHHK